MVGCLELDYANKEFSVSSKTIYGTDQNDFIDATYSNGTSWGDRVDAGAGDDTVILGPGVVLSD